MLSRTIAQTLVAKPIAKVRTPADGKSKVIVIDALDEIKKEWLPDALRLITQHLAKLPPWIRIIITSRDEEVIKNALLTTFSPTELRCDEKRNRSDVSAYLRSVAMDNVAAEIKPSDLERDVRREFGWVLGRVVRARRGGVRAPSVVEFAGSALFCSALLL